MDGYPGGVKYRAPYGANNNERDHLVGKLTTLHLACSLHCLPLLILQPLMQLLNLVGIVTNNISSRLFALIFSLKLEASDHLATTGFECSSNWLLLCQLLPQLLLLHRLLLHLRPLLPITSPVLLVHHCQRLLKRLVFAPQRLHKVGQERAGKTLKIRVSLASS